MDRDDRLEAVPSTASGDDGSPDTAAGHIGDGDVDAAPPVVRVRRARLWKAVTLAIGLATVVCGFVMVIHAAGSRPGTNSTAASGSSAASGGELSPAPDPKEVARVALVARADRAVDGDDPSFCDASIPLDARAACRALVDIGHNGRSTPADRRDLRAYLREAGYHRLYGFIVAKLDDGLFEAAYLRRTYFGPIPTSRHFLLKTNLTEYSSKGRFSLWALDAGTKPITTKDGFTQKWHIYVEVPFGSAVDQVFRAPAGAQTSKAARTTLEALASSSI